MGAEATPVVGTEDHHGILRVACLFQCVQNAAELFIHALHGGEIIGNGVAEVLAHRRAGGEIDAFGKALRRAVFVTLEVTLGDELVAGVGRVHGDDHGEGALRLPKIGDGLVGLMLRPPLLHILEAVTRGVRLPIHRAQMLIVGAIGIPPIEAVTAGGGAPFVPFLLPTIVAGGNPRAMGGIQMPLADVAQIVARAGKNVRPAVDIRPKLGAYGLFGGDAIPRHAAHPRQGTGHQNGAEGTAHGVVAHALRKGAGLLGKGIQTRRVDGIAPHEAHGLRPHLVGENQDQIGRTLAPGGPEASGAGTEAADGKEGSACDSAHGELLVHCGRAEGRGAERPEVS